MGLLPECVGAMAVFVVARLVAPPLQGVVPAAGIGFEVRDTLFAAFFVKLVLRELGAGEVDAVLDP